MFFFIYQPQNENLSKLNNKISFNKKIPERFNEFYQPKVNTKNNPRKKKKIQLIQKSIK